MTTEATDNATASAEPHPRYGPCDAMGFEAGACSECERIRLTPAEYAARLAAHSWEMFKRRVGDDFLRHYTSLPYSSAERAECREMIDALSAIHQRRQAKA